MKGIFFKWVILMLMVFILVIIGMEMVSGLGERVQSIVVK